MTIVTDMSGKRPGRPSATTRSSSVVCYDPLRGRVTGHLCSRYCDFSERPLARQFELLAIGQCPPRVRTAARDPHSELISEAEKRFARKSGKQTFGLGYFFSGCANPGGTGTGDCDAGSGGRYPPLCVLARGGADPARQKPTLPGRTSARRSSAGISITNNSMTSATICQHDRYHCNQTATLPSKKSLDEGQH